MGSGIAQVAASVGLDTILYELNETVLENARSSIEKNLQTLVEKKKITEDDKQKIFRRISVTRDYHKCVSDIVIEAIVEDYEAKISLMNQLVAINGKKTIFATNTSSLSVSQIASKVSDPRRVVGMHFFNPAPIMKLVEIVKNEHTSHEIVTSVIDLAKRFGKTPVVCKDSPGFIVNRVARPFYIESLRLVEQDISDFASIDELLEATGFKMGPFKLMDLIGNDINYTVSRSLYEQLDKPGRLKPSHIQKEKVDKGELGKKTGRGYYQY